MKRKIVTHTRTQTDAQKASFLFVLRGTNELWKKDEKEGVDFLQVLTRYLPWVKSEISHKEIAEILYSHAGKRNIPVSIFVRKKDDKTFYFFAAHNDEDV